MFVERREEEQHINIYTIDMINQEGGDALEDPHGEREDALFPSFRSLSCSNLRLFIWKSIDKSACQECDSHQH